MESDNAGFTITLTPKDVIAIQQSLRLWGKPEQVVESYNEATLQKHLVCWKKFVVFDWNEDWYDEYQHDIGCRYWIQLAIENASLETQFRLIDVITPLDEVFKSRMKPCPLRERASPDPFLEKSYFWETHTIL